MVRFPSTLVRASSLRAVPALGLLFALSCGGSRPSDPEVPESSDTYAAAEPRASAAEPDESDATPPRCTDGSCFACGDGLCPQGFYCDEGASGGPACSWIPSCAREPSCGCVTRELGASCRCEERGGGLHVSCP